MTDDRTLRYVAVYFIAVTVACLAASLVMFGPRMLALMFWPITMLYVALTALPLYGVTASARRPGWKTAIVIGALSTLPLFALTPNDMAGNLRALTLPGIFGGLVFQATIVAAERVLGLSSGEQD